MLDNFKEEQALFYNQITHNILNNKISHAFLIETNDYINKDNLILSFIKMLFCPSHYSNFNNCDGCNICHLIDNNLFSDFLIIEPDGAWIKKDQILDIKEKFKTKSFENGYRIYWIKQADKMNKQAANSLLKFLEEPEDNIIAVIETSNRYKILDTIRSRCQIYSLINNNKNNDIENFEQLVGIIKVIEEKKEHSISYLSVLLENDYKNKDFWNLNFNNMIKIYYNAIRKYENLDYFDYGEVIDYILKYNDLDSIIRKTNVLFEEIKKLEYNLNITMMIDYFIINFTRR